MLGQEYPELWAIVGAALMYAAWSLYLGIGPDKIVAFLTKIRLRGLPPLKGRLYLSRREETDVNQIIYMGWYQHGHKEVQVGVHQRRERLALPQTDLLAGHEWGRTSSAANNLAYAILTDFVRRVPEAFGPFRYHMLVNCYRDFAQQFLASASPSSFAVREHQIRTWLRTWRMINPVAQKI